MKLKIPKIFFENFFEYLYYSILTDYELWDRKYSIIIEPIFFLKIENMKIIDWKFIDECINNKFEISKNRKIIKDELNFSNWSDLDQVLLPISKNIFELDDNPLIYPYQRIETFLFNFLPDNPDLSNLFDGICHFHPTKNANLNKSDYTTIKDIGNIAFNYKKSCFFSLVIATGNIDEYIKKSAESKNNFINYMMDDIKNLSFNARIFFPTYKDKKIGISIF